MLNLIVQSTQDIFTQDLKTLAKIVGARAIEAIGPAALRSIRGVASAIVYPPISVS